MDKFIGLFKAPESEVKGKQRRSRTVPEIDADLDEVRCSLQFLKKQDLSRNRFTYDQVLDIGIWPDKILRYIEILRLAYLEFINYYSSNASIFDDALKNAIFFMQQGNYSKIREIEAFNKTGGLHVTENYFNTVKMEDNCYMAEIEDRQRSKSETKHYLLFKALVSLLNTLQSGPIIYDQFYLTDEYIKSIRIYVSIYDLKIRYAVIDETLRKMLKALLQGDTLSPSIILYLFLIDTRNEVKDFIEPHVKRTLDDSLLTYLYTFMDILSFIIYECLQFKHIFTCTDNSSFLDYTNEDPILSISVIERIQKAYGVFNIRLKEAEQRDSIVLRTDSFTDLIKCSKMDSIQIIPTRPLKYTMKYIIEKDTEIFLIDISEYSTVHKHTRKNPADSIFSPRSAKREQTLKGLVTPRDDFDKKIVIPSKDSKRDDTPTTPKENK